MRIAKFWYFSYFASLSTIFPYLNLFFRRLGLTEHQIGVIGAARPLISLPAGALWSGAADKSRRHRAVLLATFAASVAARLAIAGVGRPGGFAALLAMALLTETFAAPVTIIADSAVMAVCSAEGEYGRHRLFGALGWGLFSAVAGAAITHAGIYAAFACHAALAAVALAPTLKLPLGPLHAKLAKQAGASSGGEHRSKGDDGGWAHSSGMGSSREGRHRHHRPPRGQAGAAEHCFGQEPGPLDLPADRLAADGGATAHEWLPADGGTSDQECAEEAQGLLPDSKAAAMGAAVGAAVGEATEDGAAAAQGLLLQSKRASRPGSASEAQPLLLQQPQLDMGGGQAGPYCSSSGCGGGGGGGGVERAPDGTLAAVVLHAGYDSNKPPQLQQQAAAQQQQQQQQQRGQPGVQYWAGVWQLLRNPDALIFLAMAVCMGYGVGNIEGYLFLYLDELGGSELLMGLSLTVTCAAETLVFYFLPQILRLGIRRCMHLVFAGFLLRMGLYSGLQHASTPWLVLPVEVLHGLTFALAWGGGCAYCAQLSPPGLEATTQGLFQGLYFGLGVAAGSFAGGQVYQRLGAQAVYQVASLVLLAGWLLCSAAQLAVRAAGLSNKQLNRYLETSAVELT